MIDAVNKILQRAELETVQAASVKIERKILPSQHDVLKTIRDFGASEGWLCVTDEVLVVDRATSLSSLEGRIVLSGELVAGAKSLHIRQYLDMWEQFYLERHEGSEQILIEERFLSTPAGKQAILKYEVFWQADETGTLLPYAARFAGFEKGGNG